METTSTTGFVIFVERWEGAEMTRIVTQDSALADRIVRDLGKFRGRGYCPRKAVIMAPVERSQEEALRAARLVVYLTKKVETIA